MTTLSPISRSGPECKIQPSSMSVRLPILILPKSALSTAPGQIPVSSPTSTSPLINAVSLTKAEVAIFGDLPSKLLITATSDLLSLPYPLALIFLDQFRIGRHVHFHFSHVLRRELALYFGRGASDEGVVRYFYVL